MLNLMFVLMDIVLLMLLWQTHAKFDAKISVLEDRLRKAESQIPLVTKPRGTFS